MADIVRTPSSGPRPDPRGRAVDWKLLFNQLFALEIRKELVLPASGREAGALLDRLLRAYTNYTPVDFNDAQEQILAAESSEEAYEARAALYQDPDNRRLISQLDLSRSVGRELREREPLRSFLRAIEEHRDRAVPAGECFLGTPEGRNALRALGFDGGTNEQEVALVFVPGFAGHTIKYDLFEEFVAEVNRFHGRPAERPLLREDGIVLEFEDHATFYGRGSDRPSGFDILQPAGRELGNTTGPNTETTDALYRWITSLPERYARKKLIFLGYSKGAPIILDLINRHPDLAPRILGYVTWGGVVQGTHMARLLVEGAGSLLRDLSVGEFVDRLRSKEPATLVRFLSPLFADLDLSLFELPRIRAVFDILGHDIGPIERQIEQVLGSREIREVLEGARDLTPLERVRWNLLHLDDGTFPEPVFIFNVSALTDVKDFVYPPGLVSDTVPAGSLLTPALTDEGKLDWRRLSLDALFLYATSIEGFKTAPAGLFDAQVELVSTKSPLIDRRPLSETLTPAELEELWADDRVRAAVRRAGVRSLEDLAGAPRRDLIPADRRENLDALDLGELRAHHWSLFIQALRPPPEISTEHAVWDFPRRAFMRALVQVIAFHNVLRHCEPESRASTPGPAKDEALTALAEAGEQRDMVLAHVEGEAPVRRALINLYNLGARSVTYGLVVNSARTGLGTATPIGKALAGESLYFQALRVFSYFDWEFRRGLLNDASVWPLPASITLLAGRFPKDSAEVYPEVPDDRLVEIRQALKAMAPRLEPFELRQLGTEDLNRRAGSAEPSFAAAARKALWAGTEAKLAMIARDAYRPEATDVNTKLEAMLGAFTPLCSVFAATFDRGSPQKSTSRLTLYLPAFHTLHAEDLDYLQSWYLEKGLRELRLPRPVQLTTAEITHIRYLQEADLSRSQAIKLELRRDFDDPDQVTTLASFGSLFTGPTEDLFAFDSSDPREALHVVFRPRFSVDEGGNPADRAFREAFNRLFSAFQVEARLHHLTLHHRRQTKGSRAAGDEAVLRPRFSLEESKISFRVHNHVETAVERLSLQAAGFTCEYDPVARRFHCWRDFWTWDHLLDEFFAGRSLGGGRFTLPTYFRERLVEQLVGTATQTVLDRSIAEIEDAIDQEIARLVDDNLRRYSRARSVLIDRLHERLF